MKKLFEVPYNFSESLIPFYKKYSSCINFLFVPPYKDDSLNTRTSIETKKKGRCYMPQTREEYEYHLRKIVNAGLRFVVLWQLPNNVISTQNLDYYCNLRTSGFIIANDLNAQIIKKYNPNLLVIGSLVQRLCSNISKMDLKYYDYILLYYPFNRSIEALKRLSFIKDKIIIMPNTFCHVDCPSMHHWFPNKNQLFVQDRDCLIVKENGKYIDGCGFISPEHLYLFDNYVGGYKLQGREYTTELLKYICKIYFERKPSHDLIRIIFGDNMSFQIEHILQHSSLEKYYNTKTQDIITCI